MKENYIFILKLQTRSLRFTLLFAALVSSFIPVCAYAQLITYSFTPAGATGQSGPSQAQINTAYSATNLNNSVTVTNGIQLFTIPNSGLYRITTIGAQGGYNGGYGSSMTGDFSFSAGTVLKILVGQKGTLGTNSATFSAGGGGGGSYVSNPSNAAYIVAGGGGGNGDGYDPAPLACCLNGMQATITTSGNPNPGGSNGGSNGNGGLCGINFATAGAGAGFFGNGSVCQAASNSQSFVNGGKGGSPTINAGTGGFGGFGGGGGTYDSNTGIRGGGGGGYSGGGGGDTPTFTEPTAPAGGGGSYNTGVNQANGISTTGGDGLVTVSLMCDVNLIASGSNSVSPLICSGSSLTLTTNAATNYTWSTGNTTNTSIVVAPNITTTYTVTGSRLSGCTSTAAITVMVSPGIPTLAVICSTPSTCLGNTVMISVSGALTHTLSNGIVNGVPFLPSATVTYTLSGSNGCGTTTSLSTISVTPLPVTVSASSTLTCSGDIVVLTPAGATSYTWVPGPSVTTNFIVSPYNTTTYTVTGRSGSCAATNTITVYTNPVPTMSIAASNPTICNGNAVTMTVTGNALSYTWSPDGQTGSVIVVSPANSIVYSVAGNDANGCIGVSSELILVSQSSFIDINVSDPVVCVGGSSTLTASGAVTYTWTHNNVNSPETVVSPAGNASYSVIGTNAAGCLSSTMITVALFQPSLSVTAHTAICIGSTITIGATGAMSYTWANNNAVGQYINVSPPSNTTYTVTGTVPSGSPNGPDCPATNTLDVKVNPLPVISAGSSYTAICIGKSCLLNAEGAGALGTYTWTNGLGNSPIVSVAPIDDQTYTVTGTDANGCRSSGSYLLVVSKCLGIKTYNNPNAGLIIYPNPNNGSFTISSEQNLMLILINELGQQVNDMRVTPGTPVHIDGLAKGVYCLSGKTESGSVTQKIVVTD